MKQNLIIFFAAVLMLAMPAQAQTEVSLWKGEIAFDNSWSKNLTLAADVFSQAETADELVYTFTVTGAASTWPQIYLCDGSWKQIYQILLSQGQTSGTMTLTKKLTDTMRNGGLIIAGSGYTLTEVSLRKGPGSAGYDNAVWIGSTDATTDWVAQSISASAFSDAKVGQYLRLYYEDLKAGAQHTIVDGSWKAIDGYGFYQMSGTYYQYTIDETLLSTMQSGGIIINGTGYRLTHVDVVAPEALTVLTATVPVTSNWVYEGVQPTITINITNPYDHEVTADVKLDVKTDKLTAVTSCTDKVTVAAGASTAWTGTFAVEPGFYSITPTVNGEPVMTASAFSSGSTASSFIIGVDPTKIVSAPDMQPDFETFWNDTKAELAKVDAQYKMTEITAKSTAKRKVYLLEYQSLPNADGTEGIARAYYAEPTGDGIYPVLIHYQGYDSGDGTPWCMGGDDNPGYCELIVATRGQLINNRDPYTNTYGDWFQYGFGKKESYYYRGAFMDAIRAVDFACGRSKADETRIFAEGASQGGALTYAAAALTNHPFAAIAPSIPFLGDYPDYFDVASWPGYQARQLQKQLGMTDSEMYAFLSYFDTKNLATLIHCPVIETIGLQDNVCPPHTNIAPYNNLPADVEKQISYNPLLMHTTPSSWWTTYMNFFSGRTTSICAPTTNAADNTAASRCYDLQGRQLSTPLHRGVTIIDGRKVVR